MAYRKAKTFTGRAHSADINENGKVSKTELMAHSAAQIRELAEKHGLEYTNKPNTIDALIRVL